MESIHIVLTCLLHQSLLGLARAQYQGYGYTLKCPHSHLKHRMVTKVKVLRKQHRANGASPVLGLYPCRIMPHL